MADGQLESIWSQILYAKRALSPVRPVLKVTLFLPLHCTGVFLCIWGVLTRLDLTLIMATALSSWFLESPFPDFLHVYTICKKKKIALVWYNRKKGNTKNSVIPREKLCTICWLYVVQGPVFSNQFCSIFLSPPENSNSN